jgi:hypothetical protein
LRRQIGLRVTTEENTELFLQFKFDVEVKPFFQAEWAAKTMGDMGNRKSKGISAVGESRQVNLNKRYRKCPGTKSGLDLDWIRIKLGQWILDSTSVS